MLFYFSLSLFFFAFTAIIVDRHIVRHWPTIVGGFCLWPPLLSLVEGPGPPVAGRPKSL